MSPVCRSSSAIVTTVSAFSAAITARIFCERRGERRPAELESSETVGERDRGRVGMQVDRAGAAERQRAIGTTPCRSLGGGQCPARSRWSKRRECSESERERAGGQDERSCAHGVPPGVPVHPSLTDAARSWFPSVVTIASTSPSMSCFQASATTSMPCARQASEVTGPIEIARDARERAPVERRDEVAHRRGRAERHCIGGERRLEIAGSLAHRAIERHDRDLRAGGREALGQRVAGLLRARHERAGAGKVGRQRLDEPLADRSLGDDVGDDPALAQGRGSAGADRRDAAAGERARIAAQPIEQQPRRIRRGDADEIEVRARQRIAGDRLDADRRALDHARPEVAEPARRARWPAHALA